MKFEAYFAVTVCFYRTVSKPAIIVAIPNQRGKLARLFKATSRDQPRNGKDSDMAIATVGILARDVP